MKYVSGILSGTSHNTAIPQSVEGAVTYTAYMRPAAFGAARWRFCYHNAVDSTWADGSATLPDTPGTGFTVLAARASAADGDKRVICSVPLDFSGERELWSSTAELCIPSGGYLVFEWTLRIPPAPHVVPATPDSRLLTLKDGVPTDEAVPLPDLCAILSSSKVFGFLGDSITQGCGTEQDTFSAWSMRAGAALPDGWTPWNLGLGFGRASDAAQRGIWLRKAASCDALNVCFGVNDLLHGGTTEASLSASLDAIVNGVYALNPACRIILCTVPPFNMAPPQEAMREAVNGRIRRRPAHVELVYDFSAPLCLAEGVCRYDPHPDGSAGKTIAALYAAEVFPRL